MIRRTSAHSPTSRHRRLDDAEADPWSDYGKRVLAALDEAVKAADTARDVARLTDEVVRASRGGKAA